MRHGSFTATLFALAGALLPTFIEAQPVVGGVSPIFTCPTGNERVVVEVRQTAWPSYEQPNHRVATIVPTRNAVNLPQGWRTATAGVTTSTVRYQGFEKTVGEMVQLIPAPSWGWDTAFLNFSDPSRGIWMAEHDLLSTWIWNGTREVELTDLYHRYGYRPGTAATFIVTDTVVNDRNEWFDESVSIYCVPGSSYVTSPSQWGSTTNYYERLGLEGPWDVVLYRDWCGRWTCWNRPHVQVN